MSVIVDTPIWSFAYRRARKTSREQLVVDELISLIRREQAVLLGAIRQEVLSGINDPKHFENVRLTLRGFVELSITTDEYERTALLNNSCRRKGVQGSPNDFLICAASLHYGASIFTTDGDYRQFARITGVRLHQASNRR